MQDTTSVQAKAPLRVVSLDGGVRRAPGQLRFAARRAVKAFVSLFYAPPPVPCVALRPPIEADESRLEAYLAQAREIAAEIRQVLESGGGHIRPGDMLTVAPLAFGRRAVAGQLAGGVTASETLAVVLSAGRLARWREQRIASQAVGDIILAAQRVAQAARWAMPAHRVYVLIYESGGPDLVALNLEACRRPADAVQEARERAQLVDAMRRRFGVDSVARAALLGGEPSLILDGGLAAEPRRRVAAAAPIPVHAAKAAEPA